ncbi:hypothetical protein DITRI_Ditri11bG0056400 [Diplodiscus trichospermus]
MEENVGCCTPGVSLHRPHPEKDIIEGIFEIDHSPWLSLCATGKSVAIWIHSCQQDLESMLCCMHADASAGTGKGLRSDTAYLAQGKVLEREKRPIMAGNIQLPTKIIKFKLKFEVVRGLGTPGAFVVVNRDKHEFFLKSAIFQYRSVPATRNKDKEKFHFYCGSWVYPFHKTGVKRVFFINKLYLPSETPPGLKRLREKELEKLRGGRSKGERKPWDRVYEYDYYNDLGDPDKGREYARPVLGGSAEFPYPRRLKTGRPPCCHDPPRSYQECPDFIKKTVHFFFPGAELSTGNFSIIRSIVDFFRRNPKPLSHQDTDSLNPLDELFDIFLEKQVTEMDDCVKKKLEKLVPEEIFNQVVANATKRDIVESQLPSIIAEDKDACFHDFEFGRQMLAGTNPVRIRRAVKEDSVFVLEHYDYLLPFLNMINGTGVCAYATRTYLLKFSGSLEPIAIELRLPDPNSSKSVIFAPYDDDDDWCWVFAKLHVAANDAAYHQLVSHWLHTHAVIEPVIIATRRQLSVMHPIRRLLDPHFKDTLHVNALTRGIFLNAGGILETALFTGEFSMQLSSQLYKQCRLEDQALPNDIVKRGMAVKEEEEDDDNDDDDDDYDDDDDDENVRNKETKEKPAEKKEENAATHETQKTKVKRPAGVKLILKDYPYAKDGTGIWDAIETWVRDYCEYFYVNDDAVKKDDKIQTWWSEIRDVGHGDQKEGWYGITTRENLVKALTTLIWITSGLHAAVNFGQYAYAGWHPNRPTLLRKFIPKPDTQEYQEMMKDPSKFRAQMLPEKFEMAFVIAVMDLLSRHTSDEVYLGQRPPEIKWEEDEFVDKKFQEFSEKLKEIEKNIMKRNKKYKLRNRWGPARIPYKLLYPDTSKTRAPYKEKMDIFTRIDITGLGIPNSISI